MARPRVAVPAALRDLASDAPAVARLLDRASDAEVAVVLWGGGTSVVGDIPRAAIRP